MIYRLERPGDVDVEFDGELIANESTRDDDRGGKRTDMTRWTEVRIYRLSSGEGWVTETVGKSRRRGEVDLPRVALCRSPEEVRDSLRRKPGSSDKYIINAALDALDEAAEKDSRLLPATVEKI